MGVYRGYRDLKDKSKEQFGVFIDHKSIFAIVVTSKSNVHGNLKITKTTKDEYEKHKDDMFITYPYKNKYIEISIDNKHMYFESGASCARFLNKKFNMNTNGCSVTFACRKCNEFYGFNPKFIYLTKEEFEKLVNK